MKKLLLTALVTVSLLASAFAAPAKEVNQNISNAFAGHFPYADNIKWDMNHEYAKATFVLDNVNTEAFYTLNGEYIGTTRAITTDNLPTAAKRSFAKKYAGYIVKEAIQFEGNDGTEYYISAENVERSIILKVTNGNTEIFKVTKLK